MLLYSYNENESLHQGKFEDSVFDDIIDRNTKHGRSVANKQSCMDDEVFEKKHEGRFSQLYLFCACQIMNTAGWICFAPISSKLEYAYKDQGVDDSEVNYLSFIFMIMFLPMNFISIWIIENKGLRFSLLIGVSIQLLGFLTRYFVVYKFKMVLIGQTLIAIG